jgi:hypothetical protein
MCKTKAKKKRNKGLLPNPTLHTELNNRCQVRNNLWATGRNLFMALCEVGFINRAIWLKTNM